MLLSTTTPDTEPTLDLSAQTTFVSADGTMTFDLAIDPGDAVNPVLSLVVYGVIDSETDLDGPLPQVLNRLAPTPIASLEQPVEGVYRLAVPIRAGQPFDGLDRLKLPNEGVYPVSLELRTDEGPIASAKTHVVRLPAQTADNEQTPPTDPAPAESEVAVVLSISPGGLTLDEVIPLLVSHSETPLTVLLDTATLDRLRRDETVRTAFADALLRRPVLAASEPDLDPSALAEIEQVDLFVNLMAANSESLVALGLSPAGGLQTLDTRPTIDGLAALDSIGVKAILNIGGRVQDAGTFRTGNRAIRMVAADDELSAMLEGDGGSLRANRLLTKLTLQNQDGPVPVVVAPTDPDPTTIDALLNGLAEGPIETVLVTDIWRIGSDRRSGWLRPAERPTQDLRPVADVLWRVQQKLVTYEDFNVNSGGFETDETAAIRRGIADALSTNNSPEGRLRILEALEATLNEGLGVIELHDGQPVTLAARSAPIPVVVESSADGPRKVMLRFRSDKVRSIDDSKVIEIPPGTTSIDVELEARSLGVSPLEVSMWTPDGTTMLASTQFEIRSTAIPGLGLLVTGGAVALLGGWWVLDARARRRESEPLAHDGTGSASV